MTIPLDPIPVPLSDDGHGGLRVSSSRVTLESVLAIRNQGGSAEDIHDAFPALPLADIHAVLAWALLHPDAVADYLHRREAEAQALRQQGESLGCTSPAGVLKAKMRDRLAGHGGPESSDATVSG